MQRTSPERPILTQTDLTLAGGDQMQRRGARVKLQDIKTAEASQVVANPMRAPAV
jgi:hypothetical protein